MAVPTSLSAITLLVADMPRAHAFYLSLGFTPRYGTRDGQFTSFGVGDGYINLQAQSEPPATSWGRFVVYVDDVDAMYDRVLQAGHSPDFAPSDAPWGERYFHLHDPDGHELSFARPLG